MAVALFSRKFGLLLKQRFLQQCRTGYIVLLPEVNSEIPDQNPLFKSGLPDIEKLTHEKCVNTVGKYLLDFEHCVREVEDEVVKSSMSENEEEKKDIFEVIVEHLETLGAPLETSWGLVKTMYLTDSKVMPTDNYLSLHDRARRARSLKYNSYHIYKAFKECDPSKLTEEEQRVVSKFIVEGKLNGLELQGDKRILFLDILRKLALEKEKFRRRAAVGIQQFKHIIVDSDVISQIPDDVRERMSQNKENKKGGPWMVTLSPAIFPAFMEYCPDRDLRWNAWLASRQVCSQYAVTELHNSNTLEQIRAYRREQAKILGYDSFADMSMETKMAISVENVQNMLSMLLEKAVTMQKKEIQDLQEFAHKKGFKHDLMMWDIPYWKREQKKALFEWDDVQLREYFTLENVLEGLTDLIAKLFSVRFEHAPEVQTWHPDVKFYNLYEGVAPRPIAGLYFDPYAREGKMPGDENVGYMVGIRPSARVYGPLMPLAALIFNFKPPTKNSPCLLSFSAVDTLFRKFGNALQHLLSTVNYSEVSGMSNVEWDAVEVVSNVMSLWLNDPGVLKSISKHYSSGEELPVSNVEKVRRHMCGFDLCSEIYLANLDLQLHTKKDFWLTIVKDLWPKHFLIPFEKNDSHPCSFTSSVAGQFSAAYYTKLWARMLAIDAFTSFVSAEDVKSIGSRFRDTFLAFGGSCHPSEVFRRYQGRDPTPEAFIESLERDIFTSTQPLKD